MSHTQQTKPALPLIDIFATYARDAFDNARSGFGVLSIKAAGPVIQAIEVDAAHDKPAMPPYLMDTYGELGTRGLKARLVTCATKFNRHRPTHSYLMPLEARVPIEATFDAISLLLDGAPRPVTVGMYDEISALRINLQNDGLPKLPEQALRLAADLRALKSMHVPQVMIVSITHPQRDISCHIAHLTEAAKLPGLHIAA